MKKKILITGANGYIGKYLLKRLLKEDYELVALVRNLGKMPPWLLRNQKLTVIEADLGNENSLKKTLFGADIVFHLAAALRMFEKNGELYKTNILGLKNLLNACKKANRQIRFIFASTIDVEKKESDYTKSKLEGEEIIKNFCQKNPKVKYTIVRIGNVWSETGEGIVKGVTEIINKNNWQSSILYYVLANKRLYLIEMKNLIEKLIKLAKSPQANNKTFTLIDETLKVRRLITRLKNQKLISRYPRRLPLTSKILKIWQILGKIFKRGDLLVYLSLEK